MREIAAFLLVSIVVIVTPGQDTALTIRNSLLGGRRAGVFTAVGVSSGQAVWALASAVGVVALLVASEPLFDAVKLLGAAYAFAVAKAGNVLPRPRIRRLLDAVTGVVLVAFGLRLAGQRS